MRIISKQLSTAVARKGKGCAAAGRRPAARPSAAARRPAVRGLGRPSVSAGPHAGSCACTCFPVRALLLSAFAALALAATLLLAGCSPSVQVDSTSPRLLSMEVASSGDGTEEGQQVVATLEFDQILVGAGDVMEDLSLSIDGKAIDSGSIKAQATVQGGKLVVSLAPAEGATGPGSAKYFACYAGGLSIAAQREDGALPHLTSSQQGSTAVLDAPCQAVIPSGVAIEVGLTAAGNAAEGQPASTVFTVVSPAAIRCCTWLAIDGSYVYTHNHLFRMETEASCAEELAAAINNGFQGRFTAQADGAEVTVTAASVEDGQVIQPVICEGVGVSYPLDSFTAAE